MVNLICGICRQEFNRAKFIGIPIITQGGFYVCDKCLNNTIYPEIMKRLDNMILNGDLNNDSMPNM